MKNNIKGKIDIASIIGFILLGAVAFHEYIFGENNSFSYPLAIFFVVLCFLMLVVVLYEYFKTKNPMILFLKLFLLLMLFSKLSPYLLQSFQRGL